MRTWTPPLPTLVLASSVVILSLAAPFLMTAPETGGLAPDAVLRETTAAGDIAAGIWPGPRAETRREILIAPLFAENRRLSDPFKVAPPEPELSHEPASDGGQAVDALGMNPPDETQVARPAQENVAEPVEELIADAPPEPVRPLVLPPLRLLGTFIQESKGVARALLAESGEGAEEVWVDENDSYEDWVLTTVSPEAVRLEAGEESLTLEMWTEGGEGVTGESPIDTLFHSRTMSGG
mgnify:CR=1 FL=1